MKSDLIKGKIDRSSWPPEARICESIHLLGEVLCETHIIERYDSEEITVQEAARLLVEIPSPDLKKCLDNLVAVSELYVRDADVNLIGYLLPKQPQLIHRLSNLGKVLASSLWWERYQTIVERMGTDCKLSIVTASTMFKRDKLAPKIKGALKELVYITKEVNNV